MELRHLLAMVLAVAAAAPLLAGCGGSRPPAPVPYTSPAPETSAIEPEIDAYKILVHDELTTVVIGHPELSGPARVLPDGTMTVPGVGSLYVLGLSVGEATEKVNEAIATLVRFPQATVSVTNYGERRIFVMGEVTIPGDHAFHREMTAMAAIAQAGGFNDQAKRSSVVVLRRTGAADAAAFRLDARSILDGKDLAQDIKLRPFDIVYVPKTFIASLDVLVNQYFARLTPPFTLYLEGWNSFHADDTNIRFVAR